MLSGSLLTSGLLGLSLLTGPPQLGPEHQASIQFNQLRRIVIDPGHGGGNKGCLGVDGTYEKTVVLQIARRVERLLLEETNAIPLMTRRTDRFLSLRDRSTFANRARGDVFLSLHLNADAYGRGFGVETWFLGASAADAEAKRLVHQEESAYGHAAGVGAVQRGTVNAILRDASHQQSQAGSEVLAISVAAALARGTKATLRGVKQAPFGVLKGAQMPAIVIEAGFFSHVKEGVRLRDPAYQEVIARAIVKGLVAYDRKIGQTR